MKTRSLVLGLLVFLPVSALAADEITLEDRIRIREADRIVRALGDKMWPGWSATRRTVLLVTKEREYLINHPKPPAEFIRAGDDSLLGGPIYVRRRVFDRSLLATFPAVTGVPTVVIGQPRYTDASTSTRWVMTLIHEFFHQWQQSQGDYFESTQALGLSGGDETGMWMLDYPFPYDSRDVNDRLSDMCRRLSALLKMGPTSYAKALLRDYLRVRDDFCEMLDADDARYFSFQVWQEGIARYTEYEMARRAGMFYEPSAEYKQLRDYMPFDEDARRSREHLMWELVRVSLKKDRRTTFYHVGAAEGILLDRKGIRWRHRYFKEKFALERYFRQ